MKRLHIHVSVDDLDQSVGFYSKLFATAPTMKKTDYARWMLDDPRINFAVSTRTGGTGINHLGIQVDSAEALTVERDRLTAAGASLFDEGETTCCYAQSNKSWTTDPDGIAWETFVTHGDSETFARCCQ